MNSKGLAIFAGLVIVLAALSALPVRRGQLLNCDNGVYERARVVGYPFKAYEFTGEQTMLCVPKGQSFSLAHVVHSTFDTAAVWFDLLVNGAFLLAAYMLLESRKVFR